MSDSLKSRPCQLRIGLFCIYLVNCDTFLIEKVSQVYRASLSSDLVIACFVVNFNSLFPDNVQSKNLIIRC